MFGEDLVRGSKWQNQCLCMCFVLFCFVLLKLFVYLLFSPAFVCLTGPRMHPVPAVFQAAPIRGGGQAADSQREILHPSERRQVHRVPQPHKYGPTF